MTQTADFGLAHALMDARAQPAVQPVIDAPGMANVTMEIPADTRAWPQISHIRIGVAVIAGISLITALYLARGFFIPLLIGILASYALDPVVAWLNHRHIPRAVSAALVLALLTGGLSWVAFSLS